MTRVNTLDTERRRQLRVRDWQIWWEKYGMSFLWYNRSENQGVNDVVDGDLNKLVQLANTSPAKSASSYKRSKALASYYRHLLRCSASRVTMPRSFHRPQEHGNNGALWTRHGCWKHVASCEQRPDQNVQIELLLLRVRLDKEEGRFR